MEEGAVLGGGTRWGSAGELMGTDGFPKVGGGVFESLVAVTDDKTWSMVRFISGVVLFPPMLPSMLWRAAAFIRTTVSFKVAISLGFNPFCSGEGCPRLAAGWTFTEFASFWF